jgi:hypothetical protein
LKHVVLVADDAAAVSGEDVPVHVGGSVTWTRTQWLRADLNAIAAQVSDACRVSGVDPVIRVGGGASGYASLALSGITDSSPIKQFPWDILRTLVNQVHNAPPVKVSLVSEVEHLPETHLYGTEPDEQVEEAAKHGDDEALTKVIELAAGEDHSDAARAKSVLAQVPVEELEEWNEAHKQ